MPQRHIVATAMAIDDGPSRLRQIISNGKASLSGMKTA